MISKQDIKIWYLLNISKIQLPWDSSKRQYKFLCYDGEWRKIRKQIRKPEQLLPYIERYKPLAIYYSLGIWQNPIKLGPRIDTQGYRAVDQNLLSLDLGIDIDEPNLEIARKKALKILDIANKKYQLLYIAFSGSKGFHLVFKDHQKLPNTPKQREEQVLENRKFFILNHLKGLVEFDEGRSLNTRQVFKLPGTLVVKTGAVAQILTKEQLNKPIKDIIKYHIPFLNEESRSGMLSRINRIAKQMTESGVKSRSPSQRSMEKERSGLISSPRFYFEHFITNEVIGCNDRYVLFLHYPLRIKRYKKDIKRLIKIYRLEEVFVFKDKEEITAVCPRTFDNRRLVKILNASKSNKKYEQNKFGKEFFAINSKTTLFDVYTGPVSKTICKSKGHSSFINKFIKYIPKKTEGKNQIRKIKAKFKEVGK